MPVIRQILAEVLEPYECYSKSLKSIGGYDSWFYYFRLKTTQTCFQVFKKEGDIAQINPSHELASFSKAVSRV